MSSGDVKELRVGTNDSAKRIMYIAKEMLLNHETIDVISGTNGAIFATRAAETLVRLRYVTYADIRTETDVINNRRRTRLVLRLKKTNDFKRLYDENEANRKKLQSLEVEGTTKK